MKNQVERHAAFPSLVMFASIVAVALGQTSGGVEQLQPCYEETTHSCGAEWTDTGRMCHSGSNMIECSDIIHEDATFTRVKAADAGDPGKRSWAFAPLVTVTVERYKCTGQPPNQSCGPANSNPQQRIENKTCQGRIIQGSNCTGPAPI